MSCNENEAAILAAVTAVKKCSKCGLEKPLDAFSTHRSTKDGKQTYCHECMRAYRKDNKDTLAAAKRAYYQDNRDTITAKRRAHYKSNKDTITATKRAYREVNRERIAAAQRVYYQDNKERLATQKREYVNNRYKTDPVFNLVSRLRRRVNLALNGNLKVASTLELLGCSTATLRSHIENQFTEGMTWDNRSEWHIDHIIPVSAFNMTIEEEQRKAFHFTNLRPLWAEDNLRKSNKLPTELNAVREDPQTVSGTQTTQ